MIQASAPGKIILFGEHAVVYGQPALAVPIPDVAACAEVWPCHSDTDPIEIDAPDIGLHARLDSLPDDHPLGKMVRLTLAELENNTPPFLLRLHSTIPIAAGLGSGAATSIAIIRAISSFAEKAIPVERQSQLAYEVERIYHGTPSGVDNTVIAHQKPVWYVRGEAPQPFSIAGELTFIIADTGIHIPTSEAVGRVRRSWERDESAVMILFKQMGRIARLARRSLEGGDLLALGALMDENQSLLSTLGVSSPALDRLINTSRGAGALGAKLSGAGLGGNVIVLAGPNPETILTALDQAGAGNTILTRIGS